MNFLPSKTTNQQLILDILIGIFLVSLVYSKFLISAVSIALSIWAIKNVLVNPLPGYRFKDFIKSSFLAPSLIFIGVLLSFVNSENHMEWAHHVKLRLPFLFLPFAFFGLRNMIAKNYFKYLSWFIIVMLVSCIITMIQYLGDYQNITNSLGRGHSIPTPIDHIKYSIFVAFAALVGLSQLLHKKTDYGSKSRWFYAISSCSLVFVLHVLAVRSGLAVFYISFFFLLTRSLFKGSLNKTYGFIALGALIIGSFIAINFIPSLKNKISYMKHDYQMFSQGKGGHYSDSERLYSYQLGWEIFKESPIMGSGIGDLLEKTSTGFKTQYGLDKRKYPHNMYLFLLSGLGIVGFVLFFLGLFIPVFRNIKDLESVFVLLLIMLLVSFMVENTLQRSYSTAFFLFFYLAGLCYMEIKKGSSFDDPLIS